MRLDSTSGVDKSADFKVSGNVCDGFWGATCLVIV
jgi:hypothetical protein